jgi:hypothetical protein
VRIGALFTSQLSWRTKCKLYKRLHWLFCNGYQIDLKNNGAGIGGVSSLVHKLVKLNAVKLSRIELKLGVVKFAQPITNNDLHASDGRDTEALNCKPITNL